MPVSSVPWRAGTRQGGPKARPGVSTKAPRAAPARRRTVRWVMRRCWWIWHRLRPAANGVWTWRARPASQGPRQCPEGPSGAPLPSRNEVRLGVDTDGRPPMSTPPDLRHTEALSGDQRDRLLQCASPVDFAEGPDCSRKAGTPIGSGSSVRGRSPWTSACLGVCGAADEGDARAAGPFVSVMMNLRIHAKSLVSAARKAICTDQRGKGEAFKKTFSWSAPLSLRRWTRRSAAGTRTSRPYRHDVAVSPRSGWRAGRNPCVTEASGKGRRTRAAHGIGPTPIPSRVTRPPACAARRSAVLLGGEER